MLDLNPETVEQIIDRAHQFQMRDDMNGGEDEASPDVASISEDFSASTDDEDDLVFQELKSVIDDLEPDQQVSLVALMWLGRGDFGLSDWDLALQRAGQEWNERTADYLVRTPLLADYLGAGLEQIIESSD